ncbi:DUF2007 domain-containing protein [Metallumcola ferriviriculae]|uniref:DUF2007 domain-containing protein n=1 Tax=Metallumcola ferriviriculae TaxID=3039180 RepID=A0AAU0UPB3_9FIRM|nr:DUF2007 domain-containing protein [Desulfitibacteraceae bacterium MK1]
MSVKDGQIKWKKLCRVADIMEREIILGILRSEGIKFRQQGEALGQVYGLNAGPLAQVTVFVPEDRWEEAREILNSALELNEGE